MSVTQQPAPFSVFSSPVQDGYLGFDRRPSSIVSSVEWWQRQKQICLTFLQDQVRPDRGKQIVNLVSLCHYPMNHVLGWGWTFSIPAITESGKGQQFVGENVIGIAYSDTAVKLRTRTSTVLRQANPSLAINHGSEPHFPTLAEPQRARFPYLSLWYSVISDVGVVFHAHSVNQSARCFAASNLARSWGLARGCASRVVATLSRACRSFRVAQIGFTLLPIKVWICRDGKPYSTNFTLSI